MHKRVLLAMALALAGAVLAVQLAGAAPVSPQASLAGVDRAENGMVHQAQERRRRPLGKIGGYYSRCYYWRRECGRRWGWGSRRYRSCVALHFCTLRPAR
jgi:hypothetical protein